MLQSPRHLISLRSSGRAQHRLDALSRIVREYLTVALECVAQCMNFLRRANPLPQLAHFFVCEYNPPGNVLGEFGSVVFSSLISLSHAYLIYQAPMFKPDGLAPNITYPSFFNRTFEEVHFLPAVYDRLVSGSKFHWFRLPVPFVVFIYTFMCFPCLRSHGVPSIEKQKVRALSELLYARLNTTS